jgi:hypothetical protein
VRAEVVLDDGQRPGDDVRHESARAYVTVERPRMYNLVANEGVTSGALRLRAESAGLSAFAFTFISCVVS